MRDRTTGWLLVTPALLGLGAFMVLPLLFAVGLSFTNLRLGSPLPLRFVGLDQYRAIAADPVVRQALWNNLVFASVVVPVQTVVALGLALLLNQRLRGLALFRTLFFMPVVFPLSLVSVVWVLLYAPGPDGPLNVLLHVVTFGAAGPVDVLHDERLALPAIMATSIWQGAGFQMVVLLAGLQGIPAHLHEAARIDGAGPWSRFLHVTLPGLRRPLLFVVLVTMILSFRLFDQVQIMTRGGPVHHTTTLMHQAVQASFARQQVGTGAALTVVLLGVVLLLTAALHLAGSRGGEPRP